MAAPHDEPIASTRREAMSVNMSWTRFLFSTLTAALLMGLVGTLSQTQFVIASLFAIGADIDLATRAEMTFADLIGLGPAYFGIALIAFLAAFFCARWVTLRLPVPARLIYALAGATGIAVALILLESVFFGTQIIAGARETIGKVAQIGIGGACGYLFAAFNSPGNAQ